MNELLLATIQNKLSLNIATERKIILQPLIDFIKEKIQNNQTINLNFICTHNSRRSHLSQIWAQTMAYHFGIKNINCYSGGTEATALFFKVAETLENQGFEILKISDTINAVYALKFAENEPPIICFSKKYNDPFNPKNKYAAIVTCNNADENCPVIFGADERIPIKYSDPKAYDNTPQMDEKYMERSLEIASEMMFVFKTV